MELREKKRKNSVDEDFLDSQGLIVDSEDERQFFDSQDSSSDEERSSIDFGVEIAQEVEEESEDMSEEDAWPFEELPKELKDAGFQLGTVFEELPPVFPFEENPGPINIPDGIEDEFDMWQLYFPPELIQSWTVSTNKWFQDNNIRLFRGNLLQHFNFLAKSPLSKHHKRYQNSAVLQIEPVDMLRYLGLEYASSMIFAKHIR